VRAILKAFMIVQIYETQNCEEAKKLVEVGVDHIGVLVGNGEYPRELGLEQAKDIFRCVTGHAKRVVLSLSKNLHDIAEIVNKINPHILHLGTAPESLSPEDVHTLKQQFPNLKIMRSIPVNDETSVELAKQYDRVADYLLLDTQKQDDTQVGATGETHDWSISKRIVESMGVPVILAGGLGPDNVAEAVAFVKPFGVDSKTKTDKMGSSEKDIQRVREFVRRAKT
jgi:phosphoribosylanthranilate isomerase